MPICSFLNTNSPQMMIVVFVEHFLNEEGRRYFPQWITEIEGVLDGFEGFVSIERLADVDDSDRSTLLLRFERLDLLRTWAASPAHDRMIEQLAPYRCRKQQSQIFQVASTT